MPVFNAQGLPIQLLLLADRNFADLAAQLSIGQTLHGRVTEVLADGKAVVNFRGIPVTADLKGVTLVKGETITVRVQDTGVSPRSTGAPVFQLLTGGPVVVAQPPVSPGTSSPVSILLDQLGLPRDGFHETVARVFLEYGARPSREDVVAVKDTAVRLPALIGRTSVGRASGDQHDPGPMLRTGEAATAGSNSIRPVAWLATAMSDGYRMGRLLAARAVPVSGPGSADPAGISMAPGPVHDGGDTAGSPVIRTVMESLARPVPEPVQNVLGRAVDALAAIREPGVSAGVSRLGGDLAAVITGSASGEPASIISSIASQPAIARIVPPPGPEVSRSGIFLENSSRYAGPPERAGAVTGPVIVETVPARIPELVGRVARELGQMSQPGGGETVGIRATAEMVGLLAGVVHENVARLAPAMMRAAGVTATGTRAVADSAVGASEFAGIGVAPIQPDSAESSGVSVIPVRPGIQEAPIRPTQTGPAPLAQPPELAMRRVSTESAIVHPPIQPGASPAITRSSVTGAELPRLGAASSVNVPGILDALTGILRRFEGARSAPAVETVRAVPAGAGDSAGMASASPELPGTAVTTSLPSPTPVSQQAVPSANRNSPEPPQTVSVESPALSLANRNMPGGIPDSATVASATAGGILDSGTVASATAGGILDSGTVASATAGGILDSGTVASATAIVLTSAETELLLGRTIDLAGTGREQAAMPATAKEYLSGQSEAGVERVVTSPLEGLRQADGSSRSAIRNYPQPLPPSATFPGVDSMADLVALPANEIPPMFEKAMGPVISDPAMDASSRSKAAAAGAGRVLPVLNTRISVQVPTQTSGATQALPAPSQTPEPPQTVSFANQNTPASPQTDSMSAPFFQPTITGAVGSDLIETAVYMHLNQLPVVPQAARATYEYLYGEPRMPEVLAGFERAVETFRALVSPQAMSLAGLDAPISSTILANPAIVPAGSGETSPAFNIQVPGMTPGPGPTQTSGATQALPAPSQTPEPPQTVSLANQNSPGPTQTSGATQTLPAPSQTPYPPQTVSFANRNSPVSPQAPVLFSRNMAAPAGLSTPVPGSPVISARPGAGVIGTPGSVVGPMKPETQAAIEPVLAATDRAMAAARAVRVTPETGKLSEQLKDAVEGMGLAHEARLARAAAGGEALGPGRRDPIPAGKGSGAEDSPEGAIDRGRETLKSAMLDLSARADAALAKPGASGSIHARHALESLRDAANEVVSVVQAQQVGSLTRPDSTSVVTVQIPIVLGAELKGGDIQVSWRRGKDGKKRDPRSPARMSLEMETRALGPVNVSMCLVGSGLSLVFRVFDSEVKNFINRELPGLVERLTGLKFRVDNCACELPPVDESGPRAARRALLPTSSLDVVA